MTRHQAVFVVAILEDLLKGETLNKNRIQEFYGTYGLDKLFEAYRELCKEFKFENEVDK